MTRFFLLLSTLSLCALVCRAQQGGDLQAQILYAFDAEDSNQLASLVQSLSSTEQAGGAGNGVHYHLAHAEYRLGLLLAERHGKAAAAFSDCIDHVKLILDHEPDSVESLTLQSACYANLAKYHKLEGVLLRSRAGDRLNAAFKLAPRNPRVMYFKAMVDLSRAKPASPEHQKAFLELQQAAQVFDKSSATGVEAPGWGHAEAYLALGRELQARGDSLGARNWIEKALIVAPDFKAAQRQLASLLRH